MKIRAVRCTLYSGTIEDADVFWEERLIRPVDIYPQFGDEGVTSLARPESGSYPVREIFLHIESDSGEIGTAGPISEDQAQVVLRVMAPLLIGNDALAIERLWDVLYRYCVHGRKGVEMMAISAVDCALWDLKGRHFGVPVHVLLGGPVRDSIPAYASALGYSHDPDRVRERAAGFVSQGFGATKWFARYGPAAGKEGLEKNVALVRTLREAVGPRVEVMLDAWMSWDVPYTLAMAARLEEYSPRWIEEPVLPDKRDSYVEITRRIGNRIALAGGEHEYTRWGLHQLMEAGAAHVYQPDTYWAGGISEMLKIGALASVYDVQLIPHGHSVPANANFSFAQSPAVVPLLEYLVKHNTVSQWFLADPVHPVNGVVSPPSAPGIGMDLDEDKVETRTELGS